MQFTQDSNGFAGIVPPNGYKKETFHSYTFFIRRGEVSVLMAWYSPGSALVGKTSEMCRTLSPRLLSICRGLLLEADTVEIRKV